MYFNGIAMKNFYFRFAFIIVMCFGVSSCSAIDPITPTNYYFLLVKAKELLSLCCLLLSQTEIYHGQAISRLYYCYYHLARLLHINLRGYDAGGHQKTWQKLPLEFQKFGLCMKYLREKYDYDVITPKDLLKNLNEDFTEILKNKSTGELLLNELERTLNKCDCLSKNDISMCKEEIGVLKKCHIALMQAITERKEEHG